MKQDPVTSSDLWVLPLGGDKTPRPYLANRQNEMSACFSRDGRSVAYVSDESGRYEVYLQSFPTPGRPVRISRDGGRWPEWSKDGRELYFIAPDARRESDVGPGYAHGCGHQAGRAGLPGFVPAGPVCGGHRRERRETAVLARRRRTFPDRAGVEDTTPRLLTVVLNWKAALKGQ